MRDRYTVSTGRSSSLIGTFFAQRAREMTSCVWVQLSPSSTNRWRFIVLVRVPFVVQMIVPPGQESQLPRELQLTRSPAHLQIL